MSRASMILSLGVALGVGGTVLFTRSMSPAAPETKASSASVERSPAALAVDPGWRAGLRERERRARVQSDDGPEAEPLVAAPVPVQSAPTTPVPSQARSLEALAERIATETDGDARKALLREYRAGLAPLDPAAFADALARLNATAVKVEPPDLPQGMPLHPDDPA